MESQNAEGEKREVKPIEFKWNGCLIKATLISLIAFVGSGVLLQKWEHLNGAVRVAAILLILIGAIFTLPLWLRLGLAIVNRYIRKKIVEPLKETFFDARKLVERNRQIYAEQQEYRPANAQDFVGKDVAWYESSTTQLQSLGFTRVGDVINETIAKATGLTVVLRRFVSSDGTTMAAIYQVLYPKKATGTVKDIRTCDLESELSDGSFLTTSNSEASKTASLPAQIRSTKLPADTSIAELARVHEESKARVKAESPDVEFEIARNSEEVDAAQQRQNVIKAAFRKGIGYLDPAEVRRLAEQKFPDDPIIATVVSTQADVARRLESKEPID